MSERLQVLSALVAEHGNDPALTLLARTAASLRADEAYARGPADAVGAAFLDEEHASPLAEDALARTLARIEAADAADRRAAKAAEARAPVLAPELAALASPLREAALEALERNRLAFSGPGLRRLPLIEADGARAELFRILPGRRIATHDHLGDEVTLVLTGAYADEHGRYLPGDVAMGRPGHSHAPRALAGAVCYALVVTYGGPVFSGALGLLQRAAGFPWAPKLR